MVSQFETTLAAPLQQGDDGVSEVFVSSITTADGHDLTMDDFPFGVFYIVIEPKNSNFEIIKCQDVDAGGIGFIVTTRGLPTYFSGAETEILANIKAHSAGVDVIITDNINWFMDHFVDLHTNQTVDGIKIFTESPVVINPTNPTDVANKAYVDATVTGTVGTASTTTFGTVKVSVAPATTNTPIALGQNDPVLTTASGTASGTSNKLIDQSTLGPTTLTGFVTMYAGSAAPTGWHVCDGSSQLRAGSFAALFAVIGSQFGSADGTHFNLPDLRGRVPVGTGTGTGGGTSGSTTAPGGGAALTARTLGDWLGEETHVLTSGEGPSHSHIVGQDSGNGGSGTTVLTTGATASKQSSDASHPGITTTTSGSGTAHNTIQPVMTLNFIIKL